MHNSDISVRNIWFLIQKRSLILMLLVNLLTLDHIFCIFIQTDCAKMKLNVPIVCAVMYHSAIIYMSQLVINNTSFIAVSIGFHHWEPNIVGKLLRVFLKVISLTCYCRPQEIMPATNGKLIISNWICSCPWLQIVILCPLKCCILWPQRIMRGSKPPKFD